MLPYTVYLLLLLTNTANSGYNTELGIIQNLKNRIIDLIDLQIQYYLKYNTSVDVNLMLGVAIMKGQFMSCTDHSRIDFDQTYSSLSQSIDELFKTFYEKNLTDLKTTRKILDHRLWTSPGKIIHKSQTTPTRVADLIANNDFYFRNISELCIHQVISTCQITPECIRSEIEDKFSGYTLTHQVLYIHILRKMQCYRSFFSKELEKIIHNKCSMIFNEALYLTNDLSMLEEYKDLFIEQIAICGMQNMAEFIRSDWFMILSTQNQYECFQDEKNNPSCNSHFAGVSLAALGVYWKFLCYGANTNTSY